MCFWKEEEEYLPLGFSKVLFYLCTYSILDILIRGCEIGYILADRDPVTRENRFGGLDLLRLCIARRTYTNNHMDVIAVALKNVYDRRNEIKHGYRITWEAPLLRHFTVQLEPVL